MSHTSTIKGVTIRDVHALRAACNELKNKQGVNLTLAENVTPRAYYSNGRQQGMEQPAPFVIQLHNGRYDVGLYKTEDGKGYEARCDLWGGDISKDLGVTDSKCTDQNQRALGKLYNLYSVHAAMRAAAAQGQQVERLDRADGSVQLMVKIAA